ncbi:MOP flippase family protein [Serratia liquefaciens]|uniref:MOP flippase family protein n=1 Tax=Serratia liquefaciens TaxID=614 RepID=UPI002182D90A|nr:MOP flippase family protein [Serratia liquefaciens]CAI2538435.1 Lipopolysaccharide biosynthesis protein wzxC [Serratia liquefaciens]
MSALHKVASGVKWTSMALVVNVVMQVTQLALLSRLLTPYQIGLIGIIMLVNSFSEIFLDMGISKAIIQRKNVTKRELDSLYWFNVIVGIFIFAVLFSSKSLVAYFFHSEDLVFILGVSAFVFIIIPFGQQFVALFEKNLNFKIIAIAEILSVFVQFSFSIIFAYKGFGAISVAYAMVIASLLKVVTLNVFGWALNKPSIYFSYNEIKSFLNFGIYQALDQLVNYINGNISSFVIGRFISISNLGGFNIANNFAVNIPSKINPVITRVMFPYLSTLQNKPLELISAFSKSLFLIGFVNIALLSELYFNANELVILLFGVKWLWIVPMVKLLCFAGLFRAICYPSGVLFMALGRMRLGFWLNFFKTFLFILPIIFTSASIFGIYGVIYCLIIVQIVNFIVNGVVASIITSLAFFDYIKNFLMSIVYSLPLIITLYLLGVAFEGFPLAITFTVKCSIGLIVFIGSMYFSPRIEMRDVMVSLKLRKN